MGAAEHEGLAAEGAVSGEPPEGSGTPSALPATPDGVPSPAPRRRRRRRKGSDGYRVLGAVHQRQDRFLVTYQVAEDGPALRRVVVVARERELQAEHGAAGRQELADRARLTLEALAHLCPEAYLGL